MNKSVNTSPSTKKIYSQQPWAGSQSQNPSNRVQGKPISQIF
jgi:hypothetical protein